MVRLEKDRGRMIVMDMLAASRLSILREAWKDYRIYRGWPIPPYVGRLLRCNIQAAILVAHTLGHPFSLAEMLFASGALTTYVRRPERLHGWTAIVFTEDKPIEPKKYRYFYGLQRSSVLPDNVLVAGRIEDGALSNVPRPTSAD